MKTHSRRIISILLLLVYLPSFSLTAKDQNIKNSLNDIKSDLKTSFTSASSSLFYSGTKAESTTINFYSLKDPVFKRIFLSVSQVNSDTEQILNTCLAHYTFLHRNIPVEFTKPDISFPFHYFL